MRRKITRYQKSPIFLYLESNLTSFLPVNRNGWLIKLSTLSRGNILLMFVSKHTGQTIIRYFTEEDSAVEFINFMAEKDSTDTVDI